MFFFERRIFAVIVTCFTILQSEYYCTQIAKEYLNKVAQKRLKHS